MIRILRPSAGSWPHPGLDAVRCALSQWWHRRRGALERPSVWRWGAWRRRWLGLGIASLVCLVGWTATLLLLPNQYLSSALLFADPGRGVVLEGGADAWTAASLAALRRALLAPDALERAVGATPVTAPHATIAAGSDPSGKLAERLAIATEGPALFRVSYRAGQPAVAERALQTVVELVTGGRRSPAADVVATALRTGPATVTGAPPEASVVAELRARGDEATALRNDLAAALALRDARARELAEAAPVLAAGRRNPIYDQTAIQLGQQETLVAGLRRQLAAAEAAIGALGQHLEAGADAKATPAASRDPGAAPAAAGEPGPVFRVVLPPSRPAAPESRLRLLLLAGGAITGVAVGSALAAWRGQLDDIVDSARQLERRFRLPVLGTVSAPPTPGEQGRQRRAAIDFGLACLGLLVLFLGLASVEALDLLAPLAAPARMSPAG